MSEPHLDDASFKLSLTGDGLSIEKTLDQQTAMRVIAVAIGAPDTAGQSGSDAPSTSTSTSRRRRKTAPSPTGEGDSSKATRRRRPAGPGILKDLSLRPAGKTSFADFVAAKAPKSHLQKQTVILYWLQHEAGLTNITADHVNTCYVEAGWARPHDLENSMQLTSSKKGWINTSDSSNLRVTTRGEDMVTHDLPPKAKK